MEGRIVSTPLGFVHPDDIPEFKKKHILYFRNLLKMIQLARMILFINKNIDTNDKLSYGDSIIDREENFEDRL